MRIPKFYRRWVYRWILKRAENSTHFYLCFAPKRYFPHWGINKYPELWDRRDHTSSDCIVSFDSHEDRTTYIREALNMVS